MLSILISIIAIFITIFFVIGTHESAHFIAARLLGVKVLRFSIGFGKTLLRWHDKRGTEYVLALIPLGGYVKMLDETEGHVPKKELHLAYNRQPFYKKFLIVLAGPFSNLLCAFILYWLIFMIGFTTIKPVIGDIVPNSIAAHAGLKPNDEIVTVDGKSVHAWQSILFRLLMHAGNQDQMIVQTQSVNSTHLQIHTMDLTQWKMDDLAPDPLLSLGINPYAPPLQLVIDYIHPNSPAMSSPLKLGDKLIAIDNNKVINWESIIKTITANPNKILKSS